MFSLLLYFPVVFFLLLLLFGGVAVSTSLYLCICIMKCYGLNSPTIAPTHPHPHSQPQLSFHNSQWFRFLVTTFCKREPNKYSYFTCLHGKVEEKSKSCLTWPVFSLFTCCFNFFIGFCKISIYLWFMAIWFTWETIYQTIEVMHMLHKLRLVSCSFAWVSKINAAIINDSSQFKLLLFTIIKKTTALQKELL